MDAALKAIPSLTESFFQAASHALETGLEAVTKSVDTVFSLTDKVTRGMNALVNGLGSALTLDFGGVQKSLAETADVAQEAVSDVAETTKDLADKAADAIPSEMTPSLSA